MFMLRQTLCLIELSFLVYNYISIDLTLWKNPKLVLTNDYDNTFDHMAHNYVIGNTSQEELFGLSSFIEMDY